MSDDESSYKQRDPRLKKRDHSGDFPPPPSTIDRTNNDDIFPPGEGPAPGRSRRSRSRSRSPDGRSRRREYDSGSRKSEEDTWKKNTDAFLQNLGATPGLNPQV